MDLDEIFKKPFYIVDCKSFIYFPREVRVIGLELSFDETICIINLKEHLINENRRVPLEVLERFTSFEEAYKEAERLNEIPKNKETASEWNSPEAIFRREYMKAMLGE